MLDWIAVATMFITAFTAISSIIIAKETLKQNNKMIEESTRPYIVFYKDIIDINSPIEYLILENFGTSAGIITDMNYNDKEFKAIFNRNSVDEELIKYFSKITLAPNQKYLIPIDTKNRLSDIFSIELKYHSSVKVYNETFNINLSQDYSIIFTKQHKSDSAKEIFTISNALQELVKRK